MDLSSWRTRLLSYCLMKGLTMASVLKAAMAVVMAMAMAAVYAAVAAVGQAKTPRGWG